MARRVRNGIREISTGRSGMSRQFVTDVGNYSAERVGSKKWKLTDLTTGANRTFDSIEAVRSRVEELVTHNRESKIRLAAARASVKPPKIRNWELPQYFADPEPGREANIVRGPRRRAEEPWAYGCVGQAEKERKEESRREVAKMMGRHRFHGEKGHLCGRGCYESDK